MMKLYFKNEKTGKRYEILKLDKTKVVTNDGKPAPGGVVVLKGELAEFEEPYDKERFERVGYVLEKETVDAVKS